MTTDCRTELANIKRFDQLVRYLRDHLGWPIDSDDFEELTFEYTTEELGIDAKNAAKIQEIKRLRPLAPRQPWGIFFVKFEPKKLPVVALRRILSQVALKKRASANSAERQAWAADDLLFVSNYGEGEERRISFAHFAKAPEGQDLPTLKVLGWDNLDTALHLDAVARELTDHLAWPDDEGNIDEWRERWRGAFTLRHREVIATSRDLSIRLAALARAIRDRIHTALAIESERGPLKKLMKAFKEALVHDLDADGFADMYAQTIAYGLLSARIADPLRKTAEDFAAHMRTNPFLREMMETFLHAGGRRGRAGGPGIDFDELGVSDVVELLDDANMEAVVRDFGDRNPQEDPVIHFYELFLKEYDAKKRMQRGVFYTPRPVVSYIVRSVDELLRTEFGLADGLADTATWDEMASRHKDLKIPDGVSPNQDFVQILDPATGTGTFLVEVIDLIYKTMVAKWKRQGQSEKQIEALWNDYVPKHLLTRLHGYELLMAPYAIAHLKIGLKLYETGYRFGSDERARVYLTNALEPASGFRQMEFGMDFPALSHETDAVNSVKRKQRFTVIIGNPPYSVNSANKNSPIDSKLSLYKQNLSGERNLKPLNDDYVKFIRFCHMLIEQTGCGVVGMITNHSYTTARLFRTMRYALLQDFAFVRFLDLRGDMGRDPEMANDQNVFDIQQGVGIAIFGRIKSDKTETFLVRRYELRGQREGKYSWLVEHTINNTPWLVVNLHSPLYRFGEVEQDINSEYKAFLPLNRAFNTGNVGYQTHRDGFVIDFAEEEVISRITCFRETRCDEEQLSERFGLRGNRDWSLLNAHKELVRDSSWKNNVQSTLYRPFDLRHIVYAPYLIDYDRRDLMRHMINGNRGIMVSKVFDEHEFTSVLATKWIVESKAADRTRGSHLFPLRLYGAVRQMRPEAAGVTKWATNLSEEMLLSLKQAVGITVDFSDAPPGPGKVIDANVFDYVYGILHSPGYRARYAAFLKDDFPGIPLPGCANIFHDLAQLGGELVALHLLESPKLDHSVTEFIGGRNPEVGKVSWSKNNVWVDKAQTTGFKGVPENVWNFHIGGYQVCQKWLKDRKGRKLSKDDITHYQKIVVALNETIRLMKEIDEVIERHGGWPEAFVAGMDKTGSVKEKTAQGKVVSLRSKSEPVAQDYELEELPDLKVAVPPIPAYGEKTDSRKKTDDGQATQPRSDPDREDITCLVRQVFSIGGARERDAAISELARKLGYQRTSSRIAEELDNALRTAVRRGILENDGGALKIAIRSIEDYDRGFLKEQFVASLGGRRWIERDEAIRDFSRWLGFRRTGPSIDETARSLINGLIREGRIESNGSQIRRVS